MFPLLTTKPALEPHHGDSQFYPPALLNFGERRIEMAILEIHSQYKNDKNNENQVLLRNHNKPI